MIGPADVVSVSYVGSSGRRLLRYERPPEPGTPEAQYIIATNHGASTYHGLELQCRRRFTRGLQAIAAYTWSHSIDNGSSDSAVWMAGLDPSVDRGSSSFDVRHNFTAGLTWSVHRAGGWELSLMFRARSGFPIDVLTAENYLGIGFDDFQRPDLVAGVPLWIRERAIGQRRLNPAAFAVPAGPQGSLGRNAIAGAGMSQADVALERHVRLSGSAGLDLRLEAYNALNHPNAADPVRYLDSPLFGVPVSMLNLMLGSGNARSGLTPAFQIGGPRVMQVGVRVRF